MKTDPSVKHEWAVIYGVVVFPFGLFVLLGGHHYVASAVILIGGFVALKAWSVYSD